MQTSQLSLTLTLTRSLTLTLTVTLTLRLSLPLPPTPTHPTPKHSPGQVELFAVSSMDESNVALFPPHPTRSGLGLAELLGLAKPALTLTGLALANPSPSPHRVSVS